MKISRTAIMHIVSYWVDKAVRRQIYLKSKD